MYAVKYGCRDECVLWRRGDYFDFDWAIVVDLIPQLHVYAAASGPVAHGLWRLVVLLFRARFYAVFEYATGVVIFLEIFGIIRNFLNFFE